MKEKNFKDINKLKGLRVTTSKLTSLKVRSLAKTLLKSVITAPLIVSYASVVGITTYDITIAEALTIEEIFDFAKNKGHIKERTDITEHNKLLGKNDWRNVQNKNINIYEIFEEKKCEQILGLLNNLNVDDKSKCCLGVFFDRILHHLDKVSFECGSEQMLDYVFGKTENLNDYSCGESYVNGYLAQALLYNYANWHMCWSFEQNYIYSVNQLSEFLYSKALSIDKKELYDKIKEKLKIGSDTWNFLYKIFRTTWKSTCIYENLGVWENCGIEEIISSVQSYILSESERCGRFDSRTWRVAKDLNEGFIPPKRNRENESLSEGFYNERGLYCLSLEYFNRLESLRKRIHEIEQNFFEYKKQNKEREQEGRDPQPVTELEVNGDVLKEWIKKRLGLTQKKNILQTNGKDQNVMEKPIVSKKLSNTSAGEDEKQEDDEIQNNRFLKLSVPDHFAYIASEGFRRINNEEGKVFNYEDLIMNDGHINRIRSIFNTENNYLNLDFDYQSFYRCIFKTEAKNDFIKDPNRASSVIKENLSVFDMKDRHIKKAIKNNESDESVIGKYINLYAANMYRKDVNSFLKGLKEDEYHYKCRFEKMCRQYLFAIAPYKEVFSDVGKFEDFFEQTNELEAKDLLEYLTKNNIIKRLDSKLLNEIEQLCLSAK